MPFPVPTLEMAAKDNQLKLLMRDYMNKSLTIESFDFYFSRENNQTIYNRFVRSGAPDQVNISSDVREPLDQLATAGRWENMGPAMDRARQAIALMCQRDVLSRFALTDEYKRWYVAKHKKHTDAGVKAIAALKKELKSSKDASKLGQLMLVLEGGRTPSDRKQAYEAILALTKNPEKAKTVLKTAGVKQSIK